MSSVAKQAGSVSSSFATRSRIYLPFLMWLGGAVHVYNQPGYGFWDALIWLYYVGRFIATHYAAL